MDEIQVNKQTISFCLENKLPGVPLNKLYPNNKIDEKSKKLIIKAGAILSRIHSVRVSNFGHLNSQGIGEFKTWEDYMLNDVKQEKLFLDIAKRVKLGLDCLIEAFKILKSNKNIYQDIESRLLHSDFGPKHLLIAKDDIMGVLDMEFCKGGDIARDFAWWDYFHKDRFPVDWLMQGYGNPEILNSEFKLRMKLCGLQIGINLLYWYDLDKNQNGVNYSKQKLIENIKEFR